MWCELKGGRWGRSDTTGGRKSAIHAVVLREMQFGVLLRRSLLLPNKLQLFVAEHRGLQLP